MTTGDGGDDGVPPEAPRSEWIRHGLNHNPVQPGYGPQSGPPPSGAPWAPGAPPGRTRRSPLIPLLVGAATVLAVLVVLLLLA
ncbi:hypothetical protein GCM10017691_62740 [Pseudonocardia petroleophila]|uniref:Uncharacterized protein n=1 Tax=Pseudonocardia petroleophila TaxID=37331 RepID=A0A7G7MLW0_9PSEU|nr:hypothetical protein [Pseudonocardia petroleophila]QNG53771.1 hypothetical protein H6H00_07505 [Pseudonocardia petroleophila]